MKKLIFILFIGLLGCDPNDEPTPTPTVKDTVVVFNLYGPGIGQNVILTYTVKDSANTMVLKSYTKTVYYDSVYDSNNPLIVYIKTPGIPHENKYYHTEYSYDFSPSSGVTCVNDYYIQFVEKLDYIENTIFCGRIID